jgi:hypothetical protein
MPQVTSIISCVGLLAAVVSCGSSAPTRQEARDQATTTTCDRFRSCNLIGTAQGQSYPTDEACQLAWRSNWENAWPAADCDGKIDNAEYNVCLNAIRGTACNPLDFLSTLAKCGKQNVCRTPADGGGG